MKIKKDKMVKLEIPSSLVTNLLEKKEDCLLK